MDGWVAAHLIALGSWAGVVGVELLYEGAARLGYLRSADVARLHRWTDRVLEIPLLAAVVLTGLVLWARAGWSPALLNKVALGLGAVTANAVCLPLVERRARSAEPERQFVPIAATALVGVPLALAALAMGGRRAGWW